MKLFDYQMHTRSTAIYPGATECTPLGIAYCALGLSSEVTESSTAWRLRTATDFESNAIEELKDVMWYAARLADELGISLRHAVHVYSGRDSETFGDIQRHIKSPGITNNHVAVDTRLSRLNEASGDLAGMVKKVIRDTDGTLDAKRYRDLSRQIGAVLSGACVIMVRLGKDLDEAAQENLDKLNDRKARGVISGSGDKR